MGILIRAATQQDLPEIVRLDREIFGWYGAAEQPEIIRARLQVFPAGFIVAEADGAAGGRRKGEPGIAGYASSETWADYREPALDEDPRQTHVPGGRVFCITTLAVNPPHQGRGVGRTLLAALVGIARHARCAEIRLETAHAADFYRRNGFETLGQREQRTIPLTVMRLDLREL